LVDLITATCTFDLEKALDLTKVCKKLMKNLAREQTVWEATFIPWNEKLTPTAKPILLVKPTEKTKHKSFEFENIDDHDFQEELLKIKNAKKLMKRNASRKNSY
jgi:hypothetical protein